MFEYSTQQQGKKDKGPRLDLKVVEEFVRVAHGNLDRVKEMLEMQPALVNSTWDWGGGDWETGLGGAAHMGRRDIALYLLDHNARIDIFAAAMLGRIEVVQALVAAFPGIHKVPGPHGIPLIAHAQKAGKDAEAVFEFLRTLESA
ncbi:MAG TPA: ankyrin repeat domain-containing protein [bacterium]